MPVLRRDRLILSLVIMAGVIGLATVGVMPIVATAVGGALLMVVTGILDLEEAYGAISHRVIMMLASSIAIAAAMENSGLALMIAEGAVGVVRGLGPVALVSIFYMLTILMTELTSSNASAVMMSRIAMALAEAIGVDPRPLLMSITYSASNNFLSPKDDQTNIMVYGPGGYRFSDYLPVVVPLVILFWVVNSFLIPASGPSRTWLAATM
jgi:di/tricarboxylate transporter